MVSTTITALQETFSRMARLGANIVDAHSCFIFFPSQLVKKNILEGSRIKFNELVLTGYHSLSSDIIEHCAIEIGSGMIGWVAQNDSPVQVDNFNKDSRSLGMYRSDQALKSFLAVPISCNFSSDEKSCLTSGVLACDSKIEKAFQPLHKRLLEDLAAEISNTLHLNLLSASKNVTETSWKDFYQKGSLLMEGLNRSSVDILRVHIQNFDELETTLGTHIACDTINKIYQLIRQSLPEKYPTYQTPNGDLLLIMDNMMSLFYQNKIEELAKHVSGKNLPPTFFFYRQSFSNKQNRNKNIEEIIIATNPSLGSSTTINNKRLHVFGRA